MIYLDKNENPYGTSSLVISHLRSKLNTIHTYPDNKSSNLIKHISQVNNLPQQNIVVGSGSFNLLVDICRCLLSPGHEAIMEQYAFEMYPVICSMMGIKPKYYPIQPDSSSSYRYSPDTFTNILKNVTKKTQLIFFCNPSNPSGFWFDSLSFRNFLDELPSSVYVIVDEAYYEYSVEKDSYESVIPCVPHYSNLIVTRTFSKIYGLAGLRIGYAVANKSTIDKMQQHAIPFAVNSLAQDAAMLALSDTEFVASTIRQTDYARSMMNDLMQKQAIKCYLPNTNFIICDLPIVADLAQRELSKEGIMIKSLACYGMYHSIRVTLGTISQLTLFSRALHKILEVHHA